MCKSTLMTALFTSLLLWGAVSYASSVLALNYEKEYGAYILPLVVGKGAKSIDFVIDTGSANLMVVGTKQTCPTCKAVITKQRYHPDPKQKVKAKTAKIHYMHGGGQFSQYHEAVELQNGMHVEAQSLGSYTQGEALSNILGLAYQSIAVPKGQAGRTLFDALNAKYSLDDTFALSLCGPGKQSQLFLGKPRLTSKLTSVATLPVVVKGEYALQLEAITVGGKTVVSYQNDNVTNLAVIDSGTTNKMVLTQAKQQQIQDSLRSHYQAQDKKTQIPAAFWQGDNCVAKTLIKRELLPAVSFVFAGNKGKRVSLPLPSTNYVTNSGCPQGMLKFAFSGVKSHPPERRHPNVHNKPKSESVLSAVIGTPLLEHYFVEFTKESPAQIKFYPSLCDKKHEGRGGRIAEVKRRIQ